MAVLAPALPGRRIPARTSSVSAHDRQQRMMTERALVGRRGVLLVGLGADDRRVDVDDHLVAGRTGTRRPRPLTRRRSCGGDPAQLDRADMVERAPHRRLRRDRAEHRSAGRATQRDRERHVAPSASASTICASVRPASWRRCGTDGHRRRQPGGQARQIRGLREPRDPGVGHEPVTVAGHRARSNQAATLTHGNALRTSGTSVVSQHQSSQVGGHFRVTVRPRYERSGLVL